MVTQRKFFLMLAAVAAIVAVGIGAAYAQDDSTTTWPQPGMMGRNGISMGAHLLWDDDSAPMYTALADALGLDLDALAAELQSGKTVAQLAQEYGVDLSAVTTAAQTALQQHLDEMVAAGLLTQTQAEDRLNLMVQRWADSPLYNGTCCSSTSYGMGRSGMWDTSGDTMRGSGAMRGGRMGRGG